MAHVAASDAASEIDEAVAVHVFKKCAFRTRDENGRRVEDTASYGLVAPLHELLRFRAGHGGFYLNSPHCALSVPADGLFVQVDVHLLGLQILFEAPRTKFASEA